MVEITKEDWNQWRESSVTIAFFNTINNKREEAIQVLAYANYPPSKEKVLVGAINAYTHVLEAKFEEPTNE